MWTRLWKKKHACHIKNTTKIFSTVREWEACQAICGASKENKYTLCPVYLDGIGINP